MRKNRRVCALAALSTLLVSPVVFADEGKKTGWFNTTELNYVMTTGNSESSTLGFRNNLRRVWEPALFTLKFDAVRVESRGARFATGNMTSFSVLDAPRETTAEAYSIEGKYDHNITERFFWYAGAGWSRNRFAGVEDRYQGFGGVGNTWWDADDLQFRTSYGVSYTDRTDVTPSPGRETEFVGFRFDWTYLNRLSESTVLTNDLTWDLNLKETEDWQGKTTFAVAVAMSSHIALKVGLTWIYNNLPAVTNLNLVPGPGTVAVAKDELDTVFTTALVIDF